MPQYDNTNKGALWKKKAKSGLDYISGRVNVDGTEYNISVFTNDKQGNDARPDFNLVVDPVEGWSYNNNQNSDGGAQNNSGGNQNSSWNGDLSVEDLPF